eukprot:c2005_g1_i1.p1 GENE.c2005_g1_i1~~c2005_g1_i1.p1  ORF type:complete len:158 (-),score=18.60 c2005_g1_i1:9-482(-)
MLCRQALAHLRTQTSKLSTTASPTLTKLPLGAPLPAVQPLNQHPHWPLQPASTFAVVELCGKQWKVCEGDEIITEKLEAMVGDTIRIKDVLLLGSQHLTVVGQPLIQNSFVDAVVEEKFRDAKVRVVVSKPGKFKREYGHRQYYTRLRIESITVPSE